MIRILLVCMAAGAGVAGTAAAQGSAVDPSDGRPGWMFGWSPLADVADLARTLPGTLGSTRIAAAPSPRIGLFWTAGIPLGTAADVDRSRAELGLSRGGAGGTYRRALDPDDVAITHASGLVWRPVHDGAVTGYFEAIQRSSAGSHAASLHPHGASPFVVADSSLPAMQRLSTRLEGAAAWRFGWLEVGVSSGIELHDFRTSAARFARLGRSTVPAARFGVGVRLPPGCRFGGQVGWKGGSESLLLAPSPGPGEVYLVDGYNDPVPALVSPPNDAAFRMMDRTATLAGGGIECGTGGFRGVLHARREQRSDELVSVRQASPPTDHWDANGWVRGVALQMRGPASVLVTASLVGRELSGEARRADLDGVFFRTEESVLDGSVDLRSREDTASPWRWSVALGVRREHRLRRDLIIRVRSDVRAWTVGGRVEGARRIGSITIGVGGAIAWYTPNAVIPNAAEMGELYRRLLAREHALYALSATPTAVWLSVLYPVNSSTAFSVEFTRNHLTGRRPPAALPAAPNGGLTSWAAVLRAVLTP